MSADAPGDRQVSYAAILALDRELHDVVYCSLAHAFFSLPPTCASEARARVEIFAEWRASARTRCEGKGPPRRCRSWEVLLVGYIQYVFYEAQRSSKCLL